VLAPYYEDAVFFAADRAFLPLAWLAAKAAAAEKGRHFDVVIFTEPGAAKNLEAPPGARLVEVELPASMQAWPHPPHMSVFAYARLAAPEFWLSRYRRVLYLDSDTRITGPLTPLFTLDMQGAMLGMVEDCGRYLGNSSGRRDWAAYQQKIGLNPDAPYFNSGAMLADVAQWRAAKLWEQAQALVQTHKEGLIFMDQDALNVIGAGRILELSSRWNFQTHYFALGLEDVVHPHVLHYANVLKPWRDPEWRLLYGEREARKFAALFSASPWRHYMSSGLYTHAKIKLLRWWQDQAAIHHARRHRHVTKQEIARHVANFTAMAPELRHNVPAGFAQAAAAGRYADLTPEEASAWAVNLRA